MSGFRIALFLLDRLNDYQALLQTECEKAARRHDLRLSAVSADKSVDTQLRQIRAQLGESEGNRARAFLVCPVSEMALLPLVHDAAKLGIAWVFLSRWNDAVHDLRRDYPSVPIFAVLPDQLEIGRIQGQQLRALARAGDEVVCIQGPIGTSSSRLRRQGLEAELASRSDLHWSHFNGDWSQAGGESALKTWLSTFPANRVPPFLIAAQNDSMAVGARNAFKSWANANGQPQRSHLIALGCDGSPSFGQRLATNGELSATVVVPPVSGQAVEEIVSALRGGRRPEAEIKVAVRSHPDIDTLVGTGNRGRHR
jgi:ABC-type sugar transport system substrate-binding protein